MDLTALAEAAGLAADASEDEVLEAFKNLAAERDELKTKVASLPSDDAFKALVASAAKGEKAASDLAEMMKKTTLDKAVDEFRILPAERDSFGALYDLDPDGVAKFLAEKQPVLSGKPIGSESSVTVGDQTVTADLSPVSVDGVPTPVQGDMAKVHAAAESLLKQRGKTQYTEEEYVAACVEASATLGISLDYAPSAS